MLDGTSVVEPALRSMVVPVTDTGLMALLKFTETKVLVPMLVALLVGACDTIVGAAVSVAVPAVKTNS